MLDIQGLPNGSGPMKGSTTALAPASSSLLEFVRQSQKELQAFRSGRPVEPTGRTLTLSSVLAVARCGAGISLAACEGDVKTKMLNSRRAIDEKIAGGKSIYGVSTGFGGSADTRTKHMQQLGSALLQHQHCGVVHQSSAEKTSQEMLPLLDPLTSTSMPEAWVRAAIFVRINSLVRGHSAVRWELVERIAALLEKNIVPVVPLRGSISASGDLSPLSYVAGTVAGNPTICVFDGPSAARRIVPSPGALEEHGLSPLALQPKEQLGILNGTAFSAGLGALALSASTSLASLSLVLTAMGTEALLGTAASFSPFLHDECRPHPGQVEAAHALRHLLKNSVFASAQEEAEEERTVEEDAGELRQDRYPLRTAPQWLGPQIEDIMHAVSTITQECNSTTDNPLVDGAGGVHHGGNFQAMAVTSALEKTRLALYHIGKLLFAQCTELLNPAMNRGLPPSVAATDPSLNFHAKGLDIACAAYTSELGYLAHPVSTQVQSAEMHNQAVNSLALISARYTIDAVQVLSLLMANYLYVLCQALDLRVLHLDLRQGMADIVDEESALAFGSHLGTSHIKTLRPQLLSVIDATYERTGTMDAQERMEAIAAATGPIILDALTSTNDAPAAAFASIGPFREKLGSRFTSLFDTLRTEYLTGARGPAPASKHLRGCKPLYEFVRLTLGIRMHGLENLSMFEKGLGAEERNIGNSVTLIYEAIGDGRVDNIVTSLFE